MRTINRTALVAAAALLAPLTSQAAWVSFDSATGWNQDVIFGVGEDFATGVDATMDGGPGVTDIFSASWFAKGVDPDQPTHGLAVGTSTLSETGSGASFFVQSATSDNALMLTPTNSGTLTLSVPTSLTTLALYGSAGNGAVNGSVVVHFADLTSQTFALGAAGNDWFFVDTNVAQHVGGRTYTDGFIENNGDNPRVYESLFTLNSASPVVSVDITNTGVVQEGSSGNLAILAISGNTVPEPSAALLTAGLGLLGFIRRRR